MFCKMFCQMFQKKSDTFVAQIGFCFCWTKIIHYPLIDKCLIDLSEVSCSHFYLESFNKRLPKDQYRERIENFRFICKLHLEDVQIARQDWEF